MDKWREVAKENYMALDICLCQGYKNRFDITLLHSKRPKLYGFFECNRVNTLSLAFLSAIGLINSFGLFECNKVNKYFWPF